MRNIRSLNPGSTTHLHLQQYPPSLDELREYARDAGVMQVAWPERLELVDELPVTPTGKIRKVELKERYA